MDVDWHEQIKRVRMWLSLLLAVLHACDHSPFYLVIGLA